jgi:hypothetical protein
MTLFGSQTPAHQFTSLNPDSARKSKPACVHRVITRFFGRYNQTENIEKINDKFQ